MELKYRGVSYNHQVSQASTPQTTQYKYRGVAYTSDHHNQRSAASPAPKEKLFFRGKAYWAVVTG